jgi:serine O-acetyltransferase
MWMQKEEPALASFLYSTILSHSTMEACISFLLGNKLANSALLDTQIMMLFRQVDPPHPSPPPFPSTPYQH